MPSNERQNARKAKKRKAEQRTKKIIWAIIIIVVAALIVMKAAELDFSSVKNKFADGGVSVAVASDAYPYSLDSSKNVKVVAQNDKLGILTGVSVTVLNPTDGKLQYGFNHGYANPVMKNAGNYICVFDQGANRLRLDTLSGSVYETKTDYAILTANVAKNGNVIYASQSSDNKSSITVMNSQLKKLLELEVNTGYVVSAAIDPSGKKCAYAVINSKDAVLTTTVYTINVGDTQARASFEFSGSDILEMKYCQSDLYIVCNDAVYTVSSQKKQTEVFAKGEVNTVCWCFTSNGELVYVYSKYSSANENYLVHINSSGNVNTGIELSQMPKQVSSSSNEITILFSDKVVVYSLTKGEEKGTYKCDDSISSVYKLSTKLFVCRHQLIDVLEG